MSSDSNQSTTVIQRPDEQGIIEKAAETFHLDPEKVVRFMLRTVVRGTKNYDPTATDCAHVLLVAMNYKLNPFTKEIHAFVDRDRIIPVVGVDGWSRIANANGFDGADFHFEDDDKGSPVLCKATVWVKGRSHPVTATEYFSECYVKQRGQYPGPWQTHPRRMLRHKAFIQACRIAFSIAGIYDDDEAQRIMHVESEAREPFDPDRVIEPSEPDPLLEAVGLSGEAGEEATATSNGNGKATS